MILLGIIALSSLLQIGALVLALRLVRETGWATAWLLLACGLLLQVYRRFVVAAHVIGGGAPYRGDVQSEIAGLAISICFLAAMALIGPLMRSISDSRNTAQRLAADLRVREEELMRSEARQWAALDSTTQAFMLLDLQGCVTLLNRAAAAEAPALLGIEVRVGMYLVVALRSAQGAPLAGQIEQALGGTAMHEEIAVPGPVSPRWFDVALAPVRLEDGAVFGACVSFVDISERRRNEAALRTANAALTRSAHESEVLIELGDTLQACASDDEVFNVAGTFAARLLAGSSGALYACREGRTHEPAACWGGQPVRCSFDTASCWALRLARCHSCGPHEAALCLRGEPPAAPDGRSCVPLIAQGEPQGVLLVQPGFASDRLASGVAVGFATRVALALSNLALRRILREQAIRDPLTGLFNRRYMEETLDRETRRAARESTPLAVLMIDIDEFKSFNDRWGHEAGDAVLRDFGQALVGAVRGGDVACRYGGEEFAVALPGATLDAACRRGEQIRARIERLRVDHAGTRLPPIAVSVGVSVFPDHGQSWPDLVRAADEALYRAKAAGRNRLVVA